ncbi:MAG: hypothetical protein AABX38_07670, partial [Candidatus Micrarchaeota archaeon]
MQKIDLPYHLHIDGTIIPERVDKWLKDLGFVDAEFVGHPPTYAHFEPLRHLTLKFVFRSEFQRIFDLLLEQLRYSNFSGYIEGEKLISDIKVPDKPYEDSVSIPFSIKRRILAQYFRKYLNPNAFLRLAMS